MVEDTLRDIFDSLGDVRGGDAVREEFVKVLRALVDEGLNVDDDMLYDEPTPRPRKTSSSRIPEAMAAAGLGPAGRVGIAKSLWRRFVRAGCGLSIGPKCAERNWGYPDTNGDPRSCSVCSTQSTWCPKG